MNDAPTPSSKGLSTGLTAASGRESKSIWARVMLIGGGLLAAWGGLVSCGVVFLLASGDAGPQGPVPLILGGIVIGFSPILCGGAFCFIGWKRLRGEREKSE